MVCAWCHALIARGRVRSDFERNFGMCRPCVAEQLGRLAPPPRAPRVRRRPAPAVAAGVALPAAPG